MRGALPRQRCTRSTSDPSESLPHDRAGVDGIHPAAQCVARTTMTDPTPSTAPPTIWAIGGARVASHGADARIIG